jgi:hypothetical protein
MMNLSVTVAVAVVLAAGGCSSAEPAGPGPVTVASPAAASESAPAVAAGERIGAAGSACELPLTFQTAAEWKPSAVDAKTLGELTGLTKIGEFDVVCEIDAKPSGNIGFLRVHVAKGLSGLPREHLAAFLKADAGKKEILGATYADVRIGAQQGAEVTWEIYSADLDHRSRYSAFALNTKAGAVVVKLSPFGVEEYAGTQPAYLLAQNTVTVAD